MQIAPAVAQPVASVQPPFDLYRSSTKPCANFFPHYPPNAGKNVQSKPPIFFLERGRETRVLFQALASEIEQPF